MARKRKPRTRRTKSPHPGVVIRSRIREAGVTYYARWQDPLTGREVDTNLSKLGLSSDEARVDWCVRKSKAIAARSAALEVGDAVRTRTPPVEAVAGYLDDCRARLREQTIDAYAWAAERFAAFLTEVGVGVVEEVASSHLAGFRAAVVREPRQTSARGKGAGRGSKRAAPRKRSPATVNSVLRAVGTMLSEWRRLGLLPRLDSDAIKDALRPLPMPKPRPVFLKPEELRRLLEAALRHDTEVFALTRAEKAGGTPIGLTRRYEPIAPFVAHVLLTGCRLGEALALPWARVDLEALDEFGAPVGEIVLDHLATKTHHARAIDLAVSPGLRALLAARRLRRGDDAYVFGGADPLPEALANAALRRLVGTFGSPRCTWKTLRSTADTYLVNANGIFGGASAYKAARQLGHSVTVAERHYQGLIRGIPREARTLEAAMQIEDLVGAIVARVAGTEATARSATA